MKKQGSGCIGRESGREKGKIQKGEGEKIRNEVPSRVMKLAVSLSLLNVSSTGCWDKAK